MLPIARGDDTTHWLSDKLYPHQLPPPLKPNAPQDENHNCDQQSHHNDQPLYQRLALVRKKSSSDITLYAQLMSEHAEDLQYKPCATVDLSRPCHTRSNAQCDTQRNNQCCYAIECI